MKKEVRFTFALVSNPNAQGFFLRIYPVLQKIPGWRLCENIKSVYFHTLTEKFLVAVARVRC